MIVCDICKAPAAWMYGPGNYDQNDYCEEHVPRGGCSANVDDDGKEELDAQGRSLPCVDYIYIGDVASPPSSGDKP